MKSNFSHIGLAKLCGWFGITRQAYYQSTWEGISTSIEEEMVLKQVAAIRKDHRKIGTRKLYGMMEGFMIANSIKMGRDALFNLLAANQLLVRKRKRGVTTTNSHHWLRKYPNLIRDMVPKAINELWVSDITYWRLNGSYVYINFVTDAYSHKIVGYHMAENLEAIESIQALKMAIAGLPPAQPLRLTHHSDRGIQYCSNGYVKLLQDYKIQISMTENGDPLENAIAERVNGIMKDEYLDNHDVNNIRDARELLREVVQLYNNERPHMSIGNLTPNHVHDSKKTITTQKLWKNYYQKKTTPVNQMQD